MLRTGEVSLEGGAPSLKADYEAVAAAYLGATAMSFELYIAQQIINAVSLGSLYALVAIGLSMVFGILRMTNFAHGDMMMVGAFATLVLRRVGLPFWLAVARRHRDRRARRHRRRAGRLSAGARRARRDAAADQPRRDLHPGKSRHPDLHRSPQQLPDPGLMNAPIQFFDGQITFTQINVVTVGLTVVSLAALGWFVTRTDVGLGMRAAAEDLGAAHLVGLDVNRLIVVAFAIASAFAGLAGVLWAAQAGIVEPHMGFTPLLKAFVAAIIGGFGRIAGALVGGYLLGALEVLIVAFLPSEVSPYRDAIVFALPDRLPAVPARTAC